MTDNEELSNPGYDDISMQGTISRTIANVDQNNFLLKKNDNQLNQIVPRNQNTQESGETNEIHKKHEFHMLLTILIQMTLKKTEKIL